MSEFRIEKQRVLARLTLATGTTVSGCFFVAGATPTRASRERVGDLLNAQKGFFPFQGSDGTTALYNREHVVVVALPPGVSEAELDPGYAVATRRAASILLSTGMRVEGEVAVYGPAGRDRLSDYTRSDEQFWYLMTGERTLLVNRDHIVELVETSHR
ncbi:MAG: hypothetical protein EHM89_08740 [Acidobacteria bacterium]|jgi:hypothetical protein|nr:MAG: hypothetical protein EHM89_08740 [Acidobacteriota bacterium]